jgi:hypothetical protein
LFFTFRFDFDNDGLISKQDVRAVLSHVPLKQENTPAHSPLKPVQKMNSGSDSPHTPVSPSEEQKEKSGGRYQRSGEADVEYSDRMKSQKELSELTQLCFKEKEKINLEEFGEITENICSDIFMCMFLLIKTKLPSQEQISHILKKKKEKLTKYNTPSTPQKDRRKNLATPKFLSTFSPVAIMVKNYSSSPLIEKRDLAKKPLRSHLAEDSLKRGASLEEKDREKRKNKIWMIKAKKNKEDRKDDCDYQNHNNLDEEDKIVGRQFLDVFFQFLFFLDFEVDGIDVNVVRLPTLADEGEIEVKEIPIKQFKKHQILIKGQSTELVGFSKCVLFFMSNCRRI